MTNTTFSSTFQKFFHDFKNGLIVPNHESSDGPKITLNLSQIKTVAAWLIYHTVLDT